MSAPRLDLKALVLSPIASHPQDYGNRNRILQTTRFVRELGYEIHFLFYPIEPDWARGIPPSAREMRKEWDSFTIIPPGRPLHQPAAGEHHEIDEWWDPLIGHHLEWLFKRQFFDVMLVNYTYFAKAFEYAPRGTVKVLEMHDLFSGRKEMFAAHGVGPDFFYTTPEQEKIAFDRADIVIAIKDGEAEIVRHMTTAPSAVSVPFYMPEQPSALRPERLSLEQDLRVGFLGANNLVNVVNMRRFLERFERVQQLYVPNLTLNIAGNVCTQLQTRNSSVNLLGRIERIEDFYENVDVVIAPLMFSTGIKIKVGEALSFGKPVVATENGFDGYTPTDRLHSLKSYDEVARALVSLAYDRERLKVLENRSSLAARFARRSYEDGRRVLARSIKRLSKMVVLVTDQVIWGAGTPQQERLAQWIQLFGHTYRAVVVYVGEEGITATIRDDLNLVEFLDLSTETEKLDAVSNLLEGLDRSHNIVDLVISAEGDFAVALWRRAQHWLEYISLDLWVPALAEIANVPSGAPALADVWATQTNADGTRRGTALSLNALRYEPFALRGWIRGPSLPEIWLAPCGPDESDEVGIAMLQGAINGSVPVSLMNIDVFGRKDGADSFEAVRNRPRPSLILTIGQDRRAVAVWRSVAQQAGIACLHLSDASFPILLDDGSAAPVLCSSYADVAGRIAGLPDLASSEALHSGDTGWHSYWQLLARR